MWFARTPRLPRVSPWIWAAVCLWLTLVALAVGLSHYLRQPVDLCPFRRITGMPCPTCGMTRGVLALGRGDLLGALNFNPMAIAALLLGAGWAVLRLILGRQPRLRLSKTVRRIALATLTFLFLANWYYVIHHIG